MIYLVHLDDMQQPITQAMLVDDGEVLRFQMTESRGLAGGPAIVELEIRNPGLVILNQTGNVAVVESATGLLADARTLCRARISKIPEDLGGLTITLRLECAPASWRQLLREAANNSVAGVGIPPYHIPIVPDPGVGTIAVAFGSAAGQKWDSLKGSAIRVQGFFQQDIIRSPLASTLNFQTLSLPNALLTLTVADTPAIRAAIKKAPFAFVAVSGDKDPTHGVYFTVGAVAGFNVSFVGSLDVLVNLGSVALTASGLAVATSGDQTAGALPYYEPLFVGNTDDLSSTTLEGRSAVWHIDPVTHAITLRDTIVGARVVDLADLGDAASERRQVVERPVSRVKLRLVAEFQQTAAARVDVAPLVSLAAAGASGEVRSLSYGAPQPSATGGNLDFGWSGASPKVTLKQSLGVKRPSGRTFRVTYREDVMSWVYSTDAQGVTRKSSSWAAGQPETVEHDEYYQPVVTSITYLSWIKSTSFTQTRRETVDLLLDVDVQPFSLAEDVLDLGTLSLSDVNGIDNIQPYAEGVSYNVGDRVLWRGQAYECLANAVVAFLVPVTRVRNGIPSTTFTTPYWRSLGASTPMGDPTSPTYFEGNRGRGSVAAGFCRMRAAALKRMQALRVTKTFDWRDARDLALTDEVRFLVRDGDATLAVQGHVTELVRRVEGGGVASVDVTIGVCVGTGTAAKTAVVDGAYAQAGYVTPAYTAANRGEYVSADGTGPATFGGAGERDIEYALTATPLLEPVKARQLNNPSYAVLSVQLTNQADDQIALADSMIGRGQSPDTVAQDYPTTLDVAMRQVRAEGNIQRQFTAHGRLLFSAKGVDLQGAQA